MFKTFGTFGPTQKRRNLPSLKYRLDEWTVIVLLSFISYPSPPPASEFELKSLEMPSIITSHPLRMLHKRALAILAMIPIVRVTGLATHIHVVFQVFGASSLAHKRRALSISKDRPHGRMAGLAILHYKLSVAR
jgi:hypothetical protein